MAKCVRNANQSPAPSFGTGRGTRHRLIACATQNSDGRQNDWIRNTEVFFLMLHYTIRIALVFPLAAAGFANDWPFWRGPEQTGMTREKAAVTSWSPDGENLLWKSDIGGRSTPVIMNGRVFYICPVGEGIGSRERVVCLDADSGKLLWEHRFNVFHTDIVENRVGWTAVVGDPETGNVYAHGTGGEFFAFDRDGKLLWKHSLTEEFGRISGYGGRLHTPIVDENRVIVSFLNSNWGSHTRPLHRYVAFDKNSGDVLWWAAPGGKPLDTTYAVPAVAVIGGIRMLIAPNADGNVYGMKARTGERVWTYKLSKRGLNSSVVVDGNYAYFSHSEENLNSSEMGSIVCVDASKTGDITETGTVWRHDGYTVGYASPAIANGRLYVVSNSATLYAIDAKSGEVFWQYSLGRVGKGSPTVTADGVIYVGEQNGVFHILRDAGDKCIPLDRDSFDRDDDLVDEIYGSPAVANGRVYFMTRYGTYCLGAGGTNAGAFASTMRFEPEKSGAQGKWRIQLYPAELTLAPGESRRFTTASFGEDGRAIAVERLERVSDFLRFDGDLANAQISEFSSSLTASTANVWSVGTFRVNEEGVARVRICPKLPFESGFDNWQTGTVPPAWIGVGGGPNKKLVVTEHEGGKVLKKDTSKTRPSPPFMRLRTYFTPVLPVGYTVQCDMKSEKRDARRRSYMADMGLINTRYRVIMLGADKQRGRTTKLRIESWSPVPRLRKDVEFDWEPDTWYTVRFEVKIAAEEALCRAKVWPRGDPEPAAWSIVVTDPFPNVEGSAGLYCYSAGTTSKSDGPATYFDNLKVYRDE